MKKDDFERSCRKVHYTLHLAGRRLEIFSMFFYFFKFFFGEKRTTMKPWRNGEAWNLKFSSDWGPSSCKYSFLCKQDQINKFAFWWCASVQEILPAIATTICVLASEMWLKFTYCSLLSTIIWLTANDEEWVKGKNGKKMSQVSKR